MAERTGSNQASFEGQVLGRVLDDLIGDPAKGPARIFEGHIFRQVASGLLSSQTIESPRALRLNFLLQASGERAISQASNDGVSPEDFRAGMVIAKLRLIDDMAFPEIARRMRIEPDEVLRLANNSFGAIHKYSSQNTRAAFRFGRLPFKMSATRLRDGAKLRENSQIDLPEDFDFLNPDNPQLTQELSHQAEVQKKKFQHGKVFISDHTFDFFAAAIASGALMRAGEVVESGLWQRMQKAAWFYTWSDVSLTELAPLVGYAPKNRVGATSLIVGFIENLHRFSPPGVQDEFPLDSIQVGKPRTERYRNALSQRKGGRRGEIIERFNGGSISSYLDLVNMGMDKKIAIKRGSDLRKQGYKIETIHDKNKKLLERIVQFEPRADFRSERLRMDGDSLGECGAILKDCTYYIVKRYPEHFSTISSIASRGGLSVWE